MGGGEDGGGVVVAVLCMVVVSRVVVVCRVVVVVGRGRGRDAVMWKYCGVASQWWSMNAMVVNGLNLR